MYGLDNILFEYEFFIKLYIVEFEKVYLFFIIFVS